MIDHYKRRMVPRRTSELIALIAISTTLFLFLHTRDLSTRLKEMEIKLQPDEVSMASNQLVSGDSDGGDAQPEMQQHQQRASAKSSMKNLQSAGGEMMAMPLEPSQVNNTRKAQQEVLFFNRVPKVGSQTFMELLRRLSMLNEFGFHQDRVQRVETVRMAPDDQAALAAMVSSYDTPSVYIKHVCFTNFSEFGLPEPIYVNIVRDPVERVISWYYYVRAPWYYVERKIAFPDIPLPDPKWLKKDFETCVLSGDRECRYQTGETREGIGDHRRQSMFFCGHDYACTPFNTEGALQRAKRAVEQHYGVVGVLEDINSTLTVLEHYIPRFFTGAKDVYWNEINRYNHINRNAFKPPVNEEVKNLVRANFTKEIEFYQFCRQRLHQQLAALRIPAR